MKLNENLVHAIGNIPKGVYTYSDYVRFRNALIPMMQDGDSYEVLCKCLCDRLCI